MLTFFSTRETFASTTFEAFLAYIIQTLSCHPNKNVKILTLQKLAMNHMINRSLQWMILEKLTFHYLIDSKKSIGNVQSI